MIVVEDLLALGRAATARRGDRVVAGAQVGVALEEELLDVLEPVARVRDAQSLADDVREVDEDLAPQQIVKLLDAHVVDRSEPLQRGRLVRRVVVDVQVGVLAQAFVHKVDELLEACSSPRRGRAPTAR